MQESQFGAAGFAKNQGYISHSISFFGLKPN